MLSAENRRGRAAGADAGKSSDPRSSGRGVAAAGRTVDLVNATERRICGGDVVSSEAVASGLAASGRRAATKLRLGTASVPAPAVASGGPWIHHRVRDGAPGGRRAFELLARDPQEAVDHCLIAWRLAVALGRPGACLIDAGDAGTVSVVQAPDDGLIAEVVDGAPATAETVIDQAREAFDALSAAAGRRREMIESHGLDGADRVLVGVGAQARQAVRIAERLRESSVACGAVTLGLVQPLPAERLAELLRSRPEVVVVDCQEGSAEAEGLARALGRALGREIALLRLPAKGDVAPLVRTALGLAEAPKEMRIDTTPGPGEAIAIGVTPAGSSAERLLLEVAAAVARDRKLRLVPSSAGGADLTVLEIGTSPNGTDGAERLDLLIAAHPALLRRRELAALRTGGAVILGDADGSFRAEQLDELAERGIEIWRCDVERLLSLCDGSPAAFPRCLARAVVASRAELARLARLSDPIPATDDLPLTSVAIAELRERAASRLGSSASSPMLPVTEELPEERKSWDRRLRHFHVTGEKRITRIDPFGNLPLHPAVSGALGDDAAEVAMPMVLAAGDDDDALPLIDWLHEIAGQAEGQPSDLPLLAPRFRLLADVVRGELAGRGVVDAAEAVRAGLGQLSQQLDLSPAAAAQLAEELGRLGSRLPEGRSVCALTEPNLIAWLGRELLRRRRPQRRTFLKDLEQLVERLDERLQLDRSHSPDGGSPAALGSTLGRAGSEFFDPSALSRSLPERHGSRPIEPERRKRIEDLVRRLRARLVRSRTEPELHVVCRGPVDAGDERAAVLVHDEPLAAAVGLFDGLARRTVELLRDAHLARLEVAGVFDRELHGPVLDRFDRHVLDPQELLLVPAVVAVDRAERLSGEGAASLATFLRSGRPVSVLLCDAHPSHEIGYLAVARREALVVQSTVAAPRDLSAGLCRLAGATIPAIGVVALGDEAPRSRARLLLAHASRLTPCFRYDPSAGESWAERFELTANPDPEEAWPLVERVVRNAAGGEQPLSESVTPAHVAAVTPELREQFCVIPSEAWSSRQVDMAGFLELADHERERFLPFVWTVTPDHTLARAIVTRDLAAVCRDRRRGWRVLQELGGIRNEHARRAAEEARRAALDEAAREREALVAEHLAEVERVRNETAGEAMGRLASVLLNLDELPLPSGVAPQPRSEAVAAPGAATVEAEPAPAEEEQDQEEEVGFHDPYIDSMLCTTCNECTNLNPRMFRYNENRQAVLADLSLGTFAELVRAAEKCPARCIHPGAPRPGDESVTEELRERAKAFS